MKSERSHCHVRKPQLADNSEGALPRCDHPLPGGSRGAFFVGHCNAGAHHLMRCFFLRDGHTVGLEMQPPGLSDEDATALAQQFPY